MSVNEELSDTDKKRAMYLYELFKMDREKDSKKRVCDRNRARINEYEKAQDALEDFEQLSAGNKNLDEIIDTIIRSVHGFFSIWLEVFKDYPEIQLKILKSVNGTCMSCYDKNSNPKKCIDNLKK